MSSENILQDEVALVTGADSGIGQATAIAFAQAEADVVVCYHTDQAGAEQTRAAVAQAGRRAVVVPLDVADNNQVSRR